MAESSKVEGCRLRMQYVHVYANPSTYMHVLPGKHNVQGVDAAASCSTHVSCPDLELSELFTSRHAVEATPMA